MKSHHCPLFFRRCPALAAVTFAMSLHAGAVTSLTWDGSDTSTSGAQGGSGTWDTVTTNWWDSLTDLIWPNSASDSEAIFGGTAGTVSLASGGVNANRLLFSTAGYILQNYTLTLNGSTPTITTDADATISSILAGTSQWIKAGNGTLILNNASNSFNAGVSINAGVLSFVSGALGSGSVVMNGGSLQWSGSHTQDISSRLTLVTGTAATFDTAANNVTFATAFGSSSSASLVKTGSGMLNLTNASNSYSGGTTISAGTLQLGFNGAAGSGLITLCDTNTGSNNVQLNINDLALANAVTVANQGSGSVTISYLPASNSLTMALGNLTLNRAATFNAPSLVGSYMQLNSVLSGSGTLTVGSTNGKRLILNGASPSFTGDLVVKSGTVFEPRATLSSTTGNSVTVETDGILRINFGATSISGLNGSGTVDCAYAAETITVGKGNGSGSFSGTMTNNATVLSLTKTGTGTQELSGANLKYTGTTTVNGGILTLTDATAFDSAIALSTSGTPKLRLNATSGTWTLAKVISGANTAATVEKTGAGTLVLSGSNTYTGVTTISNGILSVATINDGGAAGNLGQASNAAANLVFDGGTLQYTGATATTNRAFTITSGKTATIAITNASTSLTISGGSAISSGSLTKSGGGTLILSGSNSYSGGTTVSAGTLQLNTATSGGSGLITLGDDNTAGNITLNLNNASLSNAITVANQGSGSVTISYIAASGAFTLPLGNLTLNRAATFSAPSLSSWMQLNSVLSGSGTLTIGSTNNQRMLLNTASPLFTGDIIVNSAAIFEPNGKLGASTGNNVTVEAGGKMQIQWSDSSIGGLNGAGEVNSTYEARTLTVGKGDASGSFSGTMKDNGTKLSITKTGTGTQTLSGANTYTGATLVKNGILVLAGGDNRLSSSSTITLGDTATSGKLVLGDSTAKSDLLVKGIAMTGTGSSVVGGHSAVSLLTIDQATGSHTFSGKLGGTGSNENNLAIKKSGAGTVTLSGSNSFSGGTTVSTGTLEFANISAGGSGAVTLNDTSTLTSATTLKLIAGTYANAITVANQGSGVSTISTASTSGTFLLNGGLTLNKATTFSATGGLGSWMFLDGSIGGTGTLTLDKTSGSNYGLILQSLTATNFSGKVVINSNATLEARNILNPNGTTKTIGNDIQVDGWLYLAGGGMDTTLNGLSGSGTIGTRWNGQSILTIGHGGGGGTFSGVIQNGTPAGSSTTALSKTGAGTQILSGVNTYTGGTTVTGGTLVVNNSSGSGTGTGAVTVSNANSKLAGTGSISGATTLNAQTIHSAGEIGGVGKQTFTNNLTYSSGSIFEWNLAASPGDATRGIDYDAVNVAGTLGGTGAIFRVVLNGTQDFSESFWDSAHTWADIFKSSDGGSALSYATVFNAGFDYANGSGTLSNPSGQGYFTISTNSLTWTAVPEPSGALAALLLGSGLLRRRRGKSCRLSVVGELGGARCDNSSDLLLDV